MAGTIPRRVFLSALGVAVSLRKALFAEITTPPDLDHLLLGTSDLDHGIDFVVGTTGVRAAGGGVHPGRGTRNALLSLGPGRYLEIIAPDPGQAVQPPMGLGRLKEPRLVGWAVHTRDLDAVAHRLQEAGIPFDGPTPGSRVRPDGATLQWRTLRLPDDRGGLLPFFIEWGHESTHPSVDAPTGCQLAQISWTAPEPAALRSLFSRMGLEAAVEKGPEGFQALIRGPKGELRASSPTKASAETP
jgi:hypothetical protein